MTNISRHLVNVSRSCDMHIHRFECYLRVSFASSPHPFFSPCLQHLLTYSLQDGDVQNVEEAQMRLSTLAQNKKLWSQQMFLDVGAKAIHLRDIQSQDELENYAYKSILRCNAINTEKHFPSLLLLVCQSEEDPKPDIHFFSCEAVKVSNTNSGPDISFLRAEREVGILNHCFDDIENFMGKLQQTAEAATVLNQRKKKKKRSKKTSAEDLLTAKARPPPEEEFIDIFQKFKYCFSLLARLKSTISSPSSEELVHHVFKPLNMMVKTTGGPALGASVSSPALTSSAVYLLQDHLSEDERQLWTSLGPNWTLPCSQLTGPVAPYTPVFLDGWKPEASRADGQVWEDPVESQHKYDALQVKPVVYHRDPESERIYSCTYDFIARNSSELSVQQGETLEVIESSKRWWKCRNRFDQIGFVPFNILDPLAHVDSPVNNKPPNVRHKNTAMFMLMNDELLQRLTNGKTPLNKPLVIPRSSETSVPLDYHSPPDEVAEWLQGKGFSEPTVACLGVLTGAQLFSLNKEELRAVIPDEGARVYSQLTVQRSLLEDARRATELETVMEKQKMKVDLKLESSTL
uniref:EPS8 signaling adaptor L1b n=1 Tax=Cyclopterus lumpus TaxID=8103 RepID=A0A8C2X5Z5_CYCLU